MADFHKHITDEWGNQFWIDDGARLHRLDGPAAIYPNGFIAYFHWGKCHRLDGPARIFPNGDIQYWVNGSIPLVFDDIVIIPEELNLADFPSAMLIPEVKYPNHVTHRNAHAYRIGDAEEQILLILKYSGVDYQIVID